MTRLARGKGKQQKAQAAQAQWVEEAPPTEEEEEEEEEEEARAGRWVRMTPAAASSHLHHHHQPLPSLLLEHTALEEQSPTFHRHCGLLLACAATSGPLWRTSLPPLCLPIN